MNLNLTNKSLQSIEEKQKINYNQKSINLIEHSEKSILPYLEYLSDEILNKKLEFNIKNMLDFFSSTTKKTVLNSLEDKTDTRYFIANSIPVETKNKFYDIDIQGITLEKKSIQEITKNTKERFLRYYENCKNLFKNSKNQPIEESKLGFYKYIYEEDPDRIKFEKSLMKGMSDFSSYNINKVGQYFSRFDEQQQNFIDYCIINKTKDPKLFILTAKDYFDKDELNTIFSEMLFFSFMIQTFSFSVEQFIVELKLKEDSKLTNKFITLEDVEHKKQQYYFIKKIVEELQFFNSNKIDDQMILFLTFKSILTKKEMDTPFSKNKNKMSFLSEKQLLDLLNSVKKNSFLSNRDEIVFMELMKVCKDKLSQYYRKNKFTFNEILFMNRMIFMSSNVNIKHFSLLNASLLGKITSTSSQAKYCDLKHNITDFSSSISFLDYLQLEYYLHSKFNFEIDDELFDKRLKINYVIEKIDFNFKYSSLKLITKNIIVPNENRFVVDKHDKYSKYSWDKDKITKDTRDVIIKNFILFNREIEEFLNSLDSEQYVAKIFDYLPNQSNNFNKSFFILALNDIKEYKKVNQLDAAQLLKDEEGSIKVASLLLGLFNNKYEIGLKQHVILIQKKKEEEESRILEQNLTYIKDFINSQKEIEYNLRDEIVPRPSDFAPKKVRTEYLEDKNIFHTTYQFKDESGKILSEKAEREQVQKDRDILIRHYKAVDQLKYFEENTKDDSIKNKIQLFNQYGAVSEFFKNVNDQIKKDMTLLSLAKDVDVKKLQELQIKERIFNNISTPKEYTIITSTTTRFNIENAATLPKVALLERVSANILNFSRLASEQYGKKDFLPLVLFQQFSIYELDIPFYSYSDHSMFIMLPFLMDGKICLLPNPVRQADVTGITSSFVDSCDALTLFMLNKATAGTTNVLNSLFNSISKNCINIDLVYQHEDFLTSKDLTKIFLLLKKADWNKIEIKINFQNKNDFKSTSVYFGENKNVTTISTTLEEQYQKLGSETLSKDQYMLIISNMFLKYNFVHTIRDDKLVVSLLEIPVLDFDYTGKTKLLENHFKNFLLDKSTAYKAMSSLYYTLGKSLILSYNRSNIEKSAIAIDKFKHLTSEQQFEYLPIIWGVNEYVEKIWSTNQHIIYNDLFYGLFNKQEVVQIFIQCQALRKDEVMSIFAEGEENFLNLTKNDYCVTNLPFYDSISESTIAEAFDIPEFKEFSLIRLQLQENFSQIRKLAELSKEKSSFYHSDEVEFIEKLSEEEKEERKKKVTLFLISNIAKNSNLRRSLIITIVNQIRMCDLEGEKDHIRSDLTIKESYDYENPAPSLLKSIQKISGFDITETKDISSREIKILPNQPKGSSLTKNEIVKVDSSSHSISLIDNGNHVKPMFLNECVEQERVKVSTQEKIVPTSTQSWRDSLLDSVKNSFLFNNQPFYVKKENEFKERVQSELNALKINDQEVESVKKDEIITNILSELRKDDETIPYINQLTKFAKKHFKYKDDKIEFVGLVKNSVQSFKSGSSLSLGCLLINPISPYATATISEVIALAIQEGLSVESVEHVHQLPLPSDHPLQIPIDADSIFRFSQIVKERRKLFIDSRVTQEWVKLCLSVYPRKIFAHNDETHILPLTGLAQTSFNDEVSGLITTSPGGLYSYIYDILKKMSIEYIPGMYNEKISLELVKSTSQSISSANAKGERKDFGDELKMPSTKKFDFVLKHPSRAMDSLEVYSTHVADILHENLSLSIATYISKQPFFIQLQNIALNDIKKRIKDSNIQFNNEQERNDYIKQQSKLSFPLVYVVEQIVFPGNNFGMPEVVASTHYGYDSIEFIRDEFVANFSNTFDDLSKHYTKDEKISIFDDVCSEIILKKYEKQDDFGSCSFQRPAGNYPIVLHENMRWAIFKIVNRLYNDPCQFAVDISMPLSEVINRNSIDFKDITLDNPNIAIWEKLFIDKGIIKPMYETPRDLAKNRDSDNMKLFSNLFAYLASGKIDNSEVYRSRLMQRIGVSHLVQGFGIMDSLPLRMSQENNIDGNTKLGASVKERQNNFKSIEQQTIEYVLPSLKFVLERQLKLNFPDKQHLNDLRRVSMLTQFHVMYGSNLNPNDYFVLQNGKGGFNIEEFTIENKIQKLNFYQKLSDHFVKSNTDIGQLQFKGQYINFKDKSKFATWMLNNLTDFDITHQFMVENHLSDLYNQFYYKYYEEHIKM